MELLNLILGQIFKKLRRSMESTAKRRHQDSKDHQGQRIGGPRERGKGHTSLDLALLLAAWHAWCSRLVWRSLPFLSLDGNKACLNSAPCRKGATASFGHAKALR